LPDPALSLRESANISINSRVIRGLCGNRRRLMHFHGIGVFSFVLNSFQEWKEPPWHPFATRLPSSWSGC
jgi:hypothetical protein